MASSGSETIGQALLDTVSGFYSKIDQKASGMMPSIRRTLEVTRTSLIKRTVATMLHSQQDEEHRGTLQTLLGHHVMHLADHLRLRDVKLFPNMDVLLAQSVWESPSIATAIPSGHDFGSKRREANNKTWTGPNSKPVNSMEELRVALQYREKMVAGFVSTLAEPLKADFVRAPGFVQYTDTPQALLPGFECAMATGYLSIDPLLSNVSQEFRAVMEKGIDALREFRMTDIQVMNFQAICAPLDSEFPLFAMVQVVKQGRLSFFDCRGHQDPVYNCGSPYCVVNGKRASSGRPTGVDGRPVLELIRKACADSDRIIPVTDEQATVVSFFFAQMWGELTAIDGTCLVFTGGNKNLLALRARDTQTLHISRILDVTHAAMVDSKPGYLAVHTGFGLLAVKDACDRGLLNKDLQRRGKLPFTMRDQYQTDIDPFTSDIGFSKLSLLYEADVGKFLSPTLSQDATYSFYTLRARRFELAISIRFQVPGSDNLSNTLLQGIPEFILFNAVNPNPRRNRALQATIHCRKRHGPNTFLCHLVYGPEEPYMGGGPYGRPFVMKISYDVAAIKREYELLTAIEQKHPTIATRVPKCYGMFSDAGETVSALFMEHFDGFYPLGIATEIGSALHYEILLWLQQLHKEYGHGALNGEHILFSPSDPKGFYVVGWSRARSVTAAPQLGLSDGQSYRALKTRKSPDVVHPEKRARH